MRILFVAMVDSIHTVRWVNQIADQGWDIHLFPSIAAVPHSGFEKLTIHDCVFRPPGLPGSVRMPKAWPWPFKEDRKRLERANWLVQTLRYSTYLARCVAEPGRRLARLIRKLKPDIVHSLEIQHAGYLTLEAKKLIGRSFPAWIVTNWGSDIYLFGRLPEHAKKIREVLSECDYYACECHRDVELGRAFGFKGVVLPVLPNTGGFDLDLAGKLREPGPSSARRLILLKGYQSWAGRALVAVRALELCADVLKGYRVAITLAGPDVEMAARLFSEASGIPVDIVPPSPHEDVLRLNGQARISIGLSISDAISASFLEAIVMGAFPIQSCTSCANEWITDGETGLLVPPEDPQPIAAAIRRALTDDALVDRAAELNGRVVRERLDQNLIRPQVVASYKQIAVLKSRKTGDGGLN